MDTSTIPAPAGLDVRCHVRSRDGMHLSSALEDGRPRLVVLGPAERLRLIAAAHARIRSPHVPELVRFVELASAPFVVLDSDAVVDLESIVPRARGERPPYAAGIALSDLLLDAVEAAHDAHGGATDGLLGGLSWSNVVIGTSGRPQLIGFGDNFLVRNREGRPLGAVGHTEAPELTLGARPTVATDVFAVHHLVLSLLPHVQPFDAFRAVRDGHDGGSLALRTALFDLSRDALAALPELRPASIAELRRRYRAVRALAPEMPAGDPVALHRALRSLIGVGEPRSSSPHRFLGLCVPDRAVRCLGAGDALRFSLASRRPVWRVLLALARAAVVSPGRTVTFDEVLEAGWPGERVCERSGRARIHVAISTLRKMGLEGWIVSHPHGYAVAHDVEVFVDDQGLPERGNPSTL